MQESRELRELSEHLTDGEITRVIRYLDPDSCAGKSREDTGTLVEIGISLFMGLTAALTYIGLYLREL